MFAFQRLRAFLFYLSLAVFFIGLPFILSFALGYKFNPRTWQFIKTGLIFIKTQPDGADIYLNRRLLKEKTPASIEELLPGTYTVGLQLEDYYPWSSEVVVEPGRVSRLEKIILFPLQPKLEQLNRERVSSFRLYPEKGTLFYLSLEDKAVYQSGMQGNHFRDIAILPERFRDIRGWEVSPDQEKLFLFNEHQIAVIHLESSDYYAYSDSPVFLDYRSKKILKVFWYSDSYHLIVVTNRDIEAVEARSGSSAVTLISLNKEDPLVFYDAERNALYFAERSSDRECPACSNVYRLELGYGFYPLDKLIKVTTSE